MEDDSTFPHIEEAKNVIAEAFKQYKMDEIGLAFNGGKDCCVVSVSFSLSLFLNTRKVLDLLVSCVGAAAVSNLLVVHFEDEDEFDEVREFVSCVCARLSLSRLSLVRASVKDGLWALTRAHPQLRAFFTGRRRSDPHAAAESHFTAASPGWPALVRVAPVINWSYTQIWAYIQSRSVPVCSLYQRGYTSLGPRNKTVPNPALRLPDGSYRHAKELQDEELERNSRIP